MYRYGCFIGMHLTITRSFLSMSQLTGEPRPFHFNNFKLYHKGFSELVHKRLSSVELSSWMGFILKEKIKVLNSNLKKWNKEVFGGADFWIEPLVHEIKVAKGPIGRIIDSSKEKHL